MEHRPACRQAGDTDFRDFHGINKKNAFYVYNQKLNMPLDTQY